MTTSIINAIMEIFFQVHKRSKNSFEEGRKKSRTETHFFFNFFLFLQYLDDFSRMFTKYSQYQVDLFKDGCISLIT